MRYRRVLLLLPGAFGPAGGLEMYDRLVIKGVQELAKAHGARVEVLILGDKEGQADPRYLDASFPEPRSFAMSRPRFSAAAARSVATFRPDLIIFGHVNFGPLALLLRALRPAARHWFLTYGIDVWTPMSRPRRLAARMAQRILSISDYTRVEMVRHNGVDAAKVELLPCALDPFWAADFAGKQGLSAADPARPVLLTVARLSADERYKGIDQVIRALPEVARAHPLVHYDVIGDGNDRARLEAIARDCGVSDRVTFHGRVSAEALAGAYAGCALFVMPSEAEGFGIVYLEAALFGKPSIAGRHGGSPEVVADGETGRLVLHDDLAGLTRALVDMLADPAGLRAMGERAKQRLDERFTYASFTRTLGEQLAR